MKEKKVILQNKIIKITNRVYINIKKKIGLGPIAPRESLPPYLPIIAYWQFMQ